MIIDSKLIIDAISNIIPIEQIIGIVIVGSALKEYRDHRSDLDVEVVVSDQHPASFSIMQVFDIDVQVFTWRILQSKLQSPDSIDHWPYSHCRVIYDPNGQVAEMTSKLAAWPDNRTEAAQIAYFGYLNAINRLKKSIERKQPITSAILVGTALSALAEMVFAIDREWSPPIHWLYENICGRPDAKNLLAAMLALTSSLDFCSIRDLDREVIRYLKAHHIYWYGAKDGVIRAYVERLQP